MADYVISVNVQDVLWQTMYDNFRIRLSCTLSSLELKKCSYM